MPEQLWQAAAKLTKQSSINQVSKALGLNCTALKKRVYPNDQSATTRTAAPAQIQKWIKSLENAKATVYETEKLRCNLCGEIFSAKIPQEAGEEKFDETANASIALLKYGAGVPFYRLEKLQQILGITLPSSTQ
jgi:hypothetical protein